MQLSGRLGRAAAYSSRPVAPSMTIISYINRYVAGTVVPSIENSKYKQLKCSSES